ncbi:MAG: hypothetical protein WCJ66_06705 [Verrucomicrobiota bacterium]
MKIILKHDTEMVPIPLTSIKNNQSNAGAQSANRSTGASSIERPAHRPWLENSVIELKSATVSSKSIP